ncbi:rRNA pseudouridine synthase [Acholeplasma equirhinis]|uniref:pseudouridine synthase n=1 Tax=Acholeplasma equirhinis TaxID=555393 RepID=UPI00197A9665|nr:pseudouridine synthase [Acholeplasma equirhinis]MBN3491169.1 rRNA pseudouridine synthase [Acholeplasma equirhinis]
MRLDKILSNLKYGSRTEIKTLIKRGLISVNEKIVKHADMQIDPNKDQIVVDQETVFYKETIILAMHKPAGYLSANQDKNDPVVIDLIKKPYDRFDFKIAGRLDKDTEGLLILTTDGEIQHEITHPKKHLDKVYEATLDLDFTEAAKLQLLEGVELKDPDGKIYFTNAKKLNYNSNKVEITIDEGKFHQVKKMFESVGFKVTYLKRIQIGELKLDLEKGTYKEIVLSDIKGK